MVAHIFREHGLWFGHTRGGDDFNPNGYFENCRVKEHMKKRHGFDVSGPMPKTQPGWRETVHDILTCQGYCGERWGLKTGVHFYDVWGEFDPIIVKVMRDRDSIVRSYELYGGVFPEHGEGFIDRGLQKLRELDGFRIDTDALVDGRRDEIEAAITGSGLEYHEDIVNGIVNPAYWHAG